MINLIGGRVLQYVKGLTNDSPRPGCKLFS